MAYKVCEKDVYWQQQIFDMSIREKLKTAIENIIKNRCKFFTMEAFCYVNKKHNPSGAKHAMNYAKKKS